MTSSLSSKHYFVTRWTSCLTNSAFKPAFFSPPDSCRFLWLRTCTLTGQTLPVKTIGFATPDAILVEPKLKESPPISPVLYEPRGTVPAVVITARSRWSHTEVESVVALTVCTPPGVTVACPVTNLTADPSSVSVQAVGVRRSPDFQSVGALPSVQLYWQDKLRTTWCTHLNQVNMLA